jgi:hypothetical protein
VFASLEASSTCLLTPHMSAPNTLVCYRVLSPCTNIMPQSSIDPRVFEASQLSAAVLRMCFCLPGVVGARSDPGHQLPGPCFVLACHACGSSVPVLAPSGTEAGRWQQQHLTSIKELD